MEYLGFLLTFGLVRGERIKYQMKVNELTARIKALQWIKQQEAASLGPTLDEPTDVTELTIVFDENDTVKRYSMSKSLTNLGDGLIK